MELTLPADIAALPGGPQTLRVVERVDNPEHHTIAAAIVEDRRTHRLLVRRTAAGLAWDCSCQTPRCPAIAALAGPAARHEQPAAARPRLFYRLRSEAGALRVRLQVGVAPAHDLPEISPPRVLATPSPRFVSAADRRAVAGLGQNGGQVTSTAALADLCATGRAFLEDSAGAPLCWGAPRPMTLRWQRDPAGAQWLETDGDGQLLSRAPAVVLDPPATLHALETRVPQELRERLAAPRDLDAVASLWNRLEDAQRALLPAPFLPREVRDRAVAPCAVLHLERRGAGNRARLTFRYDRTDVEAASAHDPLIQPCGADALRIPRDWVFEASALGMLRRTRWQGGPATWTLPGSAAALALFLLDEARGWAARGWRIESGPGVPEIRELDARALVLDLADGGLALRPAGGGPDLLSGSGSELPFGDQVLIESEDGLVVGVPAQLLLDVRMAMDRRRRPVLARLASLPLETRGDDRPLPRLLPRPRPGDAAIPPGLGAELRPYQRSGVAWLQRLDAARLGGILADDMGLGKTLQALTLLAGIHGREDDALPSLVVAPLSLLDNWSTEARRFTARLRVFTYHGVARSTDSWRGAHVVLTTYGLLRTDAERFRAREWRCVLLDEAQLIKNPRSRTARVARALRARTRLCLSGTPMENHLGELWSLAAFAVPGLLGSLKTFEQDFRRPIEAGDEERRAALARRIHPFFLRRTRDQVLSELPPRIEIERRVELGAEQRALYEALRATAQQTLAEAGAVDLPGSRARALEALTRLRQACSAPALLPVTFPGRNAPSAKLEALHEMLRELAAEGRVALVFSQFVGLLELVERRLRQQGRAPPLLTGRTSDRDAVVRRFQAGGEPVLLVSLKAGGAGLNLTRADTVILLDPWWNPAVEDQAAARAHRMGQERPVFVYRLIAADTVEDRIQRLKAGKQAGSAALVDALGTLDLTDPALIAGLLR